MFGRNDETDLATAEKSLAPMIVSGAIGLTTDGCKGSITSVPAPD